MRITGGILKGRQISVPQGIQDIRPSMDKMRESVFASLGDLTNLSFLDIFTGSGIIAVEAASRGASVIEAVEQDKLKRKILLENVSISPRRINCRFMPAELYVKRAKTAFNIIFLDPPFPYRYKWELVSKIACSNLVLPQTRILIHRPRPDYLKQDIINLHKTDSREYGRSVVDFFVYQ
ncbi:MAG: RsmD family RNA methyltransferase [Treponema sp.]|nr:RsmD family RNA methyltransferase [Treponema sp.]